MTVVPALPRLRPELKLLRWPRPAGPGHRHFARDPESGHVVELGEEAAFVCGLLDGQADVEEVRLRHEERFGKRLTDEDLEVLLERLAEAGVLQGIPARARRRTFPELFAGEAWLPYARLRLGEGDRLATHLARALRFAYSRPFHAVAAVAVVCAVWITYTRWDALMVSVAAHASPLFVVAMMLVSGLAVRSVRALVHAAQCRRHGRRVREIGVSAALYVVPALYTDWFDAARIRDKRTRAWVVLAGTYYHVLLWAVATIAWFRTEAGGEANTFWLTISFGALVTFFLFTANPLAAADGYHLLSNALEVPRLRERALASFGSWIALRPAPEVLPRRERRLFRAYGLLCFAYAATIFGWVGWKLWSTVTGAYQGPGALALVAVGVMLAKKPVSEGIARKPSVRRLLRPGNRLVRWALRLTILGLVVVAGFIPYPYETGGPLMLLPVRQTEVHTQIEGQIVRVLVAEGDLVREGQPLALVDRREYERNLTATSEQLAAAQAKLDLALAGPKQESVVTAERRLQKAAQEVEMARVRHASSSARAERYERAYADRLVTAQEYETSVHLRENDYQALQVAQKELSVAEAELQQVRSGARPEEIDALKAEVRTLRTMTDDLGAQLELTELRAPVTGRIITPYVDQRNGQYLKLGDLFATIEESRTIRAEVEVPEEDAAEVANGARVRAVPWAYPSQTFEGKVLSVAPAASENLPSSIVPGAAGHTLPKTVVRVLTEFPNPDGRLKSNMTGYGKIATRDKPLWKVLLWPIIRWCKVQVWYWIP